MTPFASRKLIMGLYKSGEDADNLRCRRCGQGLMVRLMHLKVPSIFVAEALRCPRDGKEALLESVQGRKGQFQLDVCPKCGGAWFDKGEITRISGNREIERMIVEYAGGDSSLACPHCGKKMVNRPVGDIKLDVCAKCKGVWFDLGELEKAVRMLGGEFSDVESQENPGLARAILGAGIVFAPVGAFHNLLQLSSMHNLLQPPMKRRYPPDVL